jgi:CheY-like chemotaxis protein
MPKHILIVDDSKTVRNLVAFIMKKEGFKVTTAEDGLDGLEKLYAAEQVDLIVSDVNMPRMDGFTFIKNIREQEAYRDIPIIVLSHGRAGQGHRNRTDPGRQFVHGQTRPAGKDGPQRKNASGMIPPVPLFCSQGTGAQGNRQRQGRYTRAGR